MENGLKKVEDECACSGMNVCIPPNLYVGILTPKAVVLGGGPLGGG